MTSPYNVIGFVSLQVRFSPKLMSFGNRGCSSSGGCTPDIYLAILVYYNLG